MNESFKKGKVGEMACAKGFMQSSAVQYNICINLESVICQAKMTGTYHSTPLI